METVIDDPDRGQQLDQLTHARTVEPSELAVLREQVARDQEKIAHLETALQSARIIGAAVGIIMAGEKLTPEQAFAHLSKLSNRLNTKVRDVAEAIVLTGVY